ncbi:hypothetical protein [Candidatus Palauibacter sp.]
MMAKPAGRYFWSMIDALIVFPVVALANALLYPRFFRDPAAASE